MIPAAKSGSASSRFFCFPAVPGEGTGSEPYQADILLEEDRIAMIAPLIMPGGKDGQTEQSV